VNPLLVFLCFIGGMFLLAFAVKKITGAKAYYVETFPLESGERVLWEDSAADAYPIAKRRALYVSYRRSRRARVRVTNLRIIAGAKALLRSEHMVLHVLYPSDRQFPEQAHELGGGLLTVGYQAFVFERTSAVEQATDKPYYIELKLDPNVDSSINLSTYRIYTDAIAAFRLPE
jgi:hypothetical protein